MWDVIVGMAARDTDHFANACGNENSGRTRRNELPVARTTPIHHGENQSLRYPHSSRRRDLHGFSETLNVLQGIFPLEYTMKFVLFALLVLATWNAQAQPVTASTDTLYLAPTQPGFSPGGTVTFTNNTDQVIQVYGVSFNGPFDIDWICDRRTDVQIQPGGFCVLYVRYAITGELPLGLAPGLVGFRLSTGTIQTTLFGFFYANEPIAGMRNISASLQALGFNESFTARTKDLMGSLEQVLVDGRSQNDRSVCGRLRQFGRRVENEAASDDVIEWSAAAMVLQAGAISSSLGCRHGL